MMKLVIALSLDADTRVETVFQEDTTYFKKNQIPLTNVMACATDCAKSITGLGYMAFLKAASPNVLTIHCSIYRQYFVAKNMSGRFNFF